MTYTHSFRFTTSSGGNTRDTPSEHQEVLGCWYSE